ncbi:MAG: hypothetical protein SF097_02510 [Acidobacteriota bacterium]|nr:hypothetical protein [Acidobacteriota bacterium]
MKHCFIFFLTVLWIVTFSQQVVPQDQKASSKGFADNKSLKIETPGDWKISQSETDRAIIITITPEAAQNFRLQITAIPIANLKPDANTPEQLKILAQQMGQSLLGGAEEKEVSLMEIKIDHGTAYTFRLTDKTAKPEQRKYITQLIVGIDGAVIFMNFSSVEKDSDEEKKVFEIAKTIQLVKVNRT